MERPLGLASRRASAENRAPEVRKSFCPSKGLPGESGRNTFECVVVVTATEQA